MLTSFHIDDHNNIDINEFLEAYEQCFNGIKKYFGINIQAKLDDLYVLGYSIVNNPEGKEEKRLIFNNLYREVEDVINYVLLTLFKAVGN